MDPLSRLHPNKAFPLCSSQSVSSCRARSYNTSGLVLGWLGLFSLMWSVLNLFLVSERFTVTFQTYAKLMQCLSAKIQEKRYLLYGFNGRNINDHSLNLMILALGLRQYPNSGVPNPKGLQSLLTDIFSGTGCQCFEEGYRELRLPILGSTSIVPRNNCASVCVASKFEKQL